MQILKKYISAFLSITIFIFMVLLGSIPSQTAAAASGDWPPPRTQPQAGEETGSALYHSFCAACHGAAGQGLTAAFRSQFGPDEDCAECHQNTSPAYTFPENAPALIGPKTLKRFVNARQLSNYIQVKMPWWDAGGLSASQTSPLTAHLLHQNGILVPYSPKKAHQISLRQPEQTTPNPEFGGWSLTALLALAAFSLAQREKPNETAKPGTRPSFFHHLHPPRIPANQSRWRYTLGAGGLAVFLTIIVGLTGILELFFYVPTPEQAGLSVQLITYSVPFGALIRGLHFWGAQALVIVSIIHLLRVIFTGAFSHPRRFNFLLGLVLLVILLFLNFTGYILRWDEGIHWALVVGTNLLRSIPLVGETLYRFTIGGPTLGAATLTRFYAWHIFGLTLIGALLIGWHIFRVRRDGGIAAPPTNREYINRFELVRRETLAMLISLAGLILAAITLPAPIATPISSSATVLTEIRAPWFFLWVQQLLRYGDAFWLGLGLPLAMLATLAAFPYLFPRLPDAEKGRWFPRTSRSAQIITAWLALAWLALTLLELLTQ